MIGALLRDATPNGAQNTAVDLSALRIHGPVVMFGYLGLPGAGSAAFYDDGWLRTGDLACRDKEGYYQIVSRLTDIIIGGGYSVYPREVEEAFDGHPTSPWPPCSASPTSASARR